MRRQLKSEDKSGVTDVTRKGQSAAQTDGWHIRQMEDANLSHPVSPHRRSVYDW